jgi:hypothetical protein
VQFVHYQRRAGVVQVALEPLDTSPAERWARLRDDVQRCQLRRGAWYAVLSLAPGEAVLVVRRRSAIVPLAYLEVTHSRPSRWTVLARERYAVCPNCAERVAVGQPPARMRCGKCRGVFDMEPVRQAAAIT